MAEEGRYRVYQQLEAGRPKGFGVRDSVTGDSVLGPFPSRTTADNLAERLNVSPERLGGVDFERKVLVQP